MTKTTSDDGATSTAADVNDKRGTIHSWTLQDPRRLPLDKNFKRKKFLETFIMFRLMLQDKHPDGQKLTRNQRLNYIETLKESYKTVKDPLSFKNHVIRSGRV